MENRESSVNILFNAIKYPFSNMSSFLIGGLMTVIYFIYIGIPFIIGYQVRCGRAVLRGEETLPDWGEIVELLKDGLLGLAIMIIYGVIMMALAVILYIPLILSMIYLEGYTAAIVFIVLMLLMFAVLLPFTLLMYISLMIFAHTSDLRKAINPYNAFLTFMEGPLEFVKAFIIQMVASVIISIPMLVLYVLVIVSMVIEENLICCTGLGFFVLLPWLTFPIMPAMIYVYAKYYQRVTGAGLQEASLP